MSLKVGFRAKEELLQGFSHGCTPWQAIERPLPNGCDARRASSERATISAPRVLKLRLTGTPSAQLQEQRQPVMRGEFMSVILSQNERHGSLDPRADGCNVAQPGATKVIREIISPRASRDLPTGTEGMPKRRQSKLHMAL